MHPNAQRLSDAHAAFARGDIDSIRNDEAPVFFMSPTPRHGRRHVCRPVP
jgi:hypothetical protein